MFLYIKEPYIIKFKAFLYLGGFDLVWYDCNLKKKKLFETRGSRGVTTQFYQPSGDTFM